MALRGNWTELYRTLSNLFLCVLLIVRMFLKFNIDSFLGLCKLSCILQIDHYICGCGSGSAPVLRWVVSTQTWHCGKSFSGHQSGSEALRSVSVRMTQVLTRIFEHLQLRSSLRALVVNICTVDFYKKLYIRTLRLGKSSILSFANRIRKIHTRCSTPIVFPTCPAKFCGVLLCFFDKKECAASENRLRNTALE